MKKEVPFEAAVVHEICPCCHTKMNEQIILPELLTEKVCNEIKQMHGKALNYAEEVCDACKERIPNYIHLLAIDADKSGSTMKKVYFTGLSIWLRREFVEQIIPEYESYEINNMGFIYMEDEVLRDLIRNLKEENPHLDLPEV